MGYLQTETEVPQGAVFSPMFFNIYMFEITVGLKMVLFANQKDFFGLNLLVYRTIQSRYPVPNILDDYKIGLTRLA